MDEIQAKINSNLFISILEEYKKMPRLDPFQLLKTVSVLLSPDGGIKSEHEVLRLVQLMQKFSKKIVSKTIYVEILKVTCQPLLQQFLKLEGWELLNLWFLECIKTHNWPLCVEIMTLFLVCPVTADLLKLNADVNQGPRLINQIRLNESLDDNVRGLANSVYEKWYGVLSPRKATAPVKVTIKVPSGKVVSKPLSEASNNGAPKSLLSEKDKKLRSPDDKRVNDKDKERLKAKERERDKYRDKDRDRKRKDEPSLNSSIDKERKRFRPDRRDEVNAEEKQRIKEKARLLKEEAQAKKDKETLSKVTGGTSSTGLSKIPKIPKKVVPTTDDKPKPMSFEALLGGLDTKPKNVKTPMVKNKTAALLESFSKPSSGTSKTHHHHHHHSSKKDSHSSRHEKDSKKESSSKSHGDKKSQIPPNKFPKISIPKRTSGDLESPKSKSGSFAESPSFMDAILNSMTTSEEPRKKKRRLSGSAEKSIPEGKGESSPDVKKEDGEKSMEASPEPKLEKKEPTFSFYRDTLEDPEEERPIESRRTTRYFLEF
jgi:protein phosphatase 1 regulatory subunit 10